MTVLLFGITRDIIGKPSLEVPENEAASLSSVGLLKSHLLHLFPELKNLSSLAVAVNNTYASDKTPISTSDEIALIPPVSGG
jgi:molybdopterin converting factor subunit 1